MNQPTLDTLTRRLDRLELKVRWWRFAAVVAGGLLGLVGLVGATKGPVADEIRAKRFVLVDGYGVERADLRTDSGRTRLFLVGGKTPHYGVGGKGEGAIALEASSTGSAMLHAGTMESKVFQGGFYIEVEPDNSGVLRFPAGKDGSGGIQLSTSSDGYALSIADAEGATRATLGETRLKVPSTGVIEQRPASSLVLFNKDGKVLFKAP